MIFAKIVENMIIVQTIGFTITSTRIQGILLHTCFSIEVEILKFEIVKPDFF